MSNVDKKTILILSSSFGQGHMATARALLSAAESHPELGLRVKIIDFSEEIGRLFNKTSKRVYEINTKHIPALYKWMYISTDITHTPIRLANLLSYPLRRSHLQKLIADNQPDLILSNYPIWQYIAYQLSKKYFPNVAFATLITDSITVHSSWTIPDSDFYIVANNPTADSLHKLGVAPQKIHVLGYPVHETFSSEYAELAEVNGLQDIPRDRKIILFSASALRASYVKRIIRDVCTHFPDYVLVVVAGRDKELYGSLIAYTSKLPDNCRIIGWTEIMPQLIMASEVVITKAGGSTVMECIAARRPMIINKIIPGQEEGNAELVENYELGAIAKKSTDIIEALQKIFQHYPEFISRLSQHAKPDAAETIIRFLYQSISKP